MKKLLFSLAAMIAMVATSCVQADVEDINLGGNEGVVTFVIKTDALGSRTINDGAKATALSYAIYDSEWNWIKTGEPVTMSDLQATLELRLVKNKTYNFAFWAQNSGVDCYTLDFVAKTLSVDYDGLTANNDNYDAFYGTKTITVDHGTVNESVFLTRPFAQINFAAADTDVAIEAGYNVATAATKFETVAYTQMSLKTGDVLGDAVPVTFTATTNPDESLYLKSDVNKENPLDWLAMNYILWKDEEHSLGACKMTIYNGTEEASENAIVIDYPMAPAKRNWRTNLVGNLLTEAAVIKVEIDPYFEGEKVINPLQPITIPGTNEYYQGVGIDGDGAVVVTEEVGLVSLSALVAADEGNFAGKTVKLQKDIDLKAAANASTLSTRTSSTSTKIGDSDAPIGSTGERDGRGRLICEPFKGTFDGNGKTIKNLYQSGWDFGYEWGQYGSIGLFSELEGATVKNLTIEGMTAQVEGGDISFIAGSATGECVFENITIKNSQIGTYNNGCGGIIGWSGAGHYTFKNIVLESDAVLAGLWGSFDSSIGGIVGQAEPGATYIFDNVKINCRIDAYNDVTAAYKYYCYRMCGMIIGRCEETITIDGRNYPDLSKYNLSFNDVEVNFGEWMNYHYCVVEGKTAWRVEPGFAYGGVPADHDHSTCAMHCNLYKPFDVLIGGEQYGVYGHRTLDDPEVKVTYPASYDPNH